MQLLLDIEDDTQVMTVTPEEVANVMLRWRLMQRINHIRAFKITSKLVHSCAATVHFEYNMDMKLGEIIARYDFGPQTRIGAWLLEDVSLWWKGTDQRARELQRKHFFLNVCQCERCLG